MILLSNIPLVVCIAGVILYLAVSHAKVARVGEIMFIVGLSLALYFGIRT